MTKIIFFGSFGRFSKIYLQCLKDAGFEVVLAVEDKNISFTELENKIKNIKIDLGVIAYFGKIIPKNILSIPKKGFINAHPSLLPRWRGPSPVQNTILANDAKTGVTIHVTAEKIDAGDIVVQKEIAVLKNDTCATLTERLAKEGATLLVKTIPKYIDGEIKLIPQNEKQVTFTKMITKEDGLIDWSRSPEYIERLIRAYDPWPGTFVKIKSKNNKEKIIKIKKAEVADGKLKILVVQPEGKKEMPFEAFLKGNPDFTTKI